jgi:hypothetical protein
MDKYKRLKHGEASFTLEERFDDVEKAANPSTEGEFVEIKISNLKIDFTKVIKEQDGRVKDSPSKVQGSSREETQEVPGSQKKSK